jgi:uncharacterized membrane protein YqaE (UPF0057 family)
MVGQFIQTNQSNWFSQPITDFDSLCLALHYQSVGAFAATANSSTLPPVPAIIKTFETKPPTTRSSANQTTGEPVTVDVIRILIAIILPPVGVFLQVGLGLHFWLNILLTLCGYVPGIIHAIWIILRR